MTDSFMHNHQSALDSFMEDKAIQDLEDAGIYPEPDNTKLCFCDETQNGDSEKGHYHCKKCDCVLTQYEENICCSCEEDDEPIDEDFLLMSSFGTKWHDGL